MVRDIEAQNAADAGAVAGAWALADGSNWSNATYDLIGQNDFDPGTAAVSLASTNAPNDTIVVDITDTVPTVFAGIFGVASLDVHAHAAAIVEYTPGGDYALYANSPSCGETIDWSGSSNAVVGRVHSNNEIDLSGSDNSVDGPTTLAGSMTISGSGNLFTPPWTAGPIESYPVGFQIADFAPGGSKANLAGASGRYYNAGSTNIDMGWLIDNGYFNPSTGAIQNGLYYTSGEIHLSDSDMTGTVTFVSSGGDDQVERVEPEPAAMGPGQPVGLLQPHDRLH